MPTTWPGMWPVFLRFTWTRTHINTLTQSFLSLFPSPTFLLRPVQRENFYFHFSSSCTVLTHNIPIALMSLCGLCLWRYVNVKVVPLSTCFVAITDVVVAEFSFSFAFEMAWEWSSHSHLAYSHNKRCHRTGPNSYQRHAAVDDGREKEKRNAEEII